jgi:hypothetical protein
VSVLKYYDTATSSWRPLDLSGAAAYAGSGGDHDHDQVYVRVDQHLSVVSDPHPQYLTPAEGNAAYDPKNTAGSLLAAHVAADSPHTTLLPLSGGQLTGLLTIARAGQGLEMVGAAPWLRLHHPQVSYATLGLRAGGGLAVRDGLFSGLAQLQIGEPVNVSDAATMKYVNDRIVQSASGSNTLLTPSQEAVRVALTYKADLASPTFTGTPSAPTPTTGSNNTYLATTAFVQTAVATRAKVTVSASAPSGPAVGDIWVAP